MTVKQIRAQIRETRQEMKAKGIRRISCLNGGLLGEVYSLNAKMFSLETALKSAMAKEPNYQEEKDSYAFPKHWEM